MTDARYSVVVGRLGAMAILAVLALGTTSALARPADRQPPTAPHNLRVTGSAHYSVSLAGDASTDNSGFLTY